MDRIPHPTPESAQSIWTREYGHGPTSVADGEGERDAAAVCGSVANQHGSKADDGGRATVFWAYVEELHSTIKANTQLTNKFTPLITLKADERGAAIVGGGNTGGCYDRVCAARN